MITISRRGLVAAVLTMGLVAAACGGDDTSDDASTGPGSAEVIDNSDTVGAEPTPAPTPDRTPGAEPAATPSPGAAPPPEPTPAPTLLTGAEVPPLRLVAVAQLTRPVAMTARPGSAALWVAEQAGTVWRVTAEDSSPVLDLTDEVSSGSEQGLLGLAFSPEGDRLFVNYTDTSGDTNVVEYEMSGDRPDPATARTVLVVEQPAANHNAGALAFGPEGHLYVTMGDGGGAGDPFGTGQDPASLLGSILRIDPLGGDPYAIPADNPFLDRPGRPETWLYGVRNPWRISFDRSTGDLWIADVGQNAVEEVNVAYAAAGGGRGANLGWSLVEGSAPFAGTGPPTEDYLGPIYEYTHAEGCSVTGGYVYRGSAIAALDGVYIFGDYCTSAVWGLLTTPEDGLIGRVDLGLQLAPTTLVSFGQGPDGELYVLSFDGAVYRLEPG